MSAIGRHNQECKVCGPRRARPACFTLIEVMAVLVIMTILLMAGMGVYGDFVARHRLQASAQRLVTDLSFVRQHAITTGTTLTIQFTPGTGRYGLVESVEIPYPQGLTGEPYEVDLAASPYQATIVTADFGGDTQIQFDAYGVPDSGGAVVLEVGDQQNTVAVDSQTGQAAVQ